MQSTQVRVQTNFYVVESKNVSCQPDEPTGCYMGRNVKLLPSLERFLRHVMVEGMEFNKNNNNKRREYFFQYISRYGKGMQSHI